MNHHTPRDTEEPHDTEEKNNREIETLALMVAVYCKGNHKGKEKCAAVLKDKNGHSILKHKLCADCKELVQYAHKRVENCRVEDAEAFCSECAVHCYNAEKREKIRTVMRYSGPRMIFHNPKMAIRHLLAMRKASAR